MPEAPAYLGHLFWDILILEKFVKGELRQQTLKWQECYRDVTRVS